MVAHKLYRWSIDRINGRFAAGWCFNRLQKTRPVTIVVTVDDTVIGEFTNDGYRPDLVEQKLHPTGVCAFDFSFPAAFDPASHTSLSVFFDTVKKPIATFACRELEMLRPRLAKPVCFMHVPKTAGTSFNSFARNCFAGDRFITHIERLGGDARRRTAESADYFAGHLPLYELLELPAAARTDLYTIIREPYAHLHSHLNYVKGVTAGTEVENRYEYRHNDTIKRFSVKLNHIDFAVPETIRTFVDGLAEYERDFFDNMQTRYFLDYRPAVVARGDLEQATRNFSRFRSIGLTEHYEAFRDRFCADIGLSPQTQDLQSNKSSSYRLFDLSDPHIRAALKPLVVHDLDLYRAAADLIAPGD